MSIKAGIVVLACWFAAPAPTSAQSPKAPDPARPDLAAWDWTQWLLGSWEGYRERQGERIPFRQSFELVSGGAAVLTRMERGEGPGAYRGTGMFLYDPATGQAYGSWVGSLGDTNWGTAHRDGERMVWSISRAEDRIVRTRERVGPDAYVVTNRSLGSDGEVTESREVMRRVGPVAAAVSGAPQRDEIARIKRDYLADLEILATKFRALADAFPEALYDYRPMDGVRSVREVLLLIIAENYVIVPGALGVAAPEGYGRGPGAAAHLANLPQDRLVEVLGESFDHVKRVVSDAPDPGPARFAGRTRTLSDILLYVAVDAHEHLGQLIAYARTNRIVPPWSRG